MKQILTGSLVLVSGLFFAQQTLTGTVIEGGTDKPLQGITVSDPKGNRVAVTDRQGVFVITLPASATKLRLSGLGYEAQEIDVTVPFPIDMKITLLPKIKDIEGVTVSTGYQKISKERATGSFSTVSADLLSKQVTTNIIERLPALANGIVLDYATTGTPQLMVRGLSTMQGPKNPLIILDDFPYEGDLNTINPEMVESITVLKDAAASSIWGARAANGVIVITTKRAGLRQPLKVEVTASTTISDKPDLGYIRQISSADFVEVEQEMFSRGYYDSDINSPNHVVLTPAVDFLNQEKKGLITAAELQYQLNLLKQIDVRDQYRKYMYQPAQNLQYSVNVSEGGPKLAWTTGLGYDDNTGSLGEKYQRMNFRLQNTWKPIEPLTISTGVLFTNTRSRSGRSGYGSVNVKGNWNVPYLQFADEAGQPLVVFSGYDQHYKDSSATAGLLDWNYYPLKDWEKVTNTNNNDELILNGSLRYKIIKGLEAEVKYQYQQSKGVQSGLFGAQSYYARNYTNTFAQADAPGILQFKVPKGGILDRSQTASEINNLRGQLNYHYRSENHEVVAIAGAETRATDIHYEGNRYYGYNEITHSSISVDYTQQYPSFVTGGTAFIQNGQSMRDRKTRFVSLYSNAAYTFDRKYTISGSIRRDASNLFGLKTNDQWNPFWSGGVAWKVSDENFYTASWLPTLKLRGSYGFNGNIDPAMVAVTTIIYDSNPSMITGTPMARIDQYYNPNLRWETSRIINVGLDFSSQNNRIAGSVEFFTKKGSNLFGAAPLDYTTGITTLLWNVAGMQGKGLDVELKTTNIETGSFQWRTLLNFSQYRDEVTNYYRQNAFASNYVSANGSSLPITGVEGLPVYSMFGYQWAGLNPETGNPRGYLNGELSEDYSAITGSEKGIEDLQYFGSAIPTMYGSLLNSFSLNDFTLDIGLTYKLGYWFRRSSVDYTDLVMSRNGHSDFAKRWKQPGDELVTDVPSFNYTLDSARDLFYNGSSVLIEKADHVRLQFLNLNYQLKPSRWANLPFASMQIFCSANNLGILWRANTQQLDPDYSWGNASLKPATTYSLGFRAQF